MKQRAPRNRTLTCGKAEMDRLSTQIFRVQHPVDTKDIEGKIIGGDIFEIAEKLPNKFVDLLILDPPYNLSKNYHGHLFKAKEKDDYQKWFQNAIEILIPTLHPNATIYACSDWKTSVLIAPILESHFHIRNRITNTVDSFCNLPTNPEEANFGRGTLFSAVFCHLLLRFGGHRVFSM